MKLCLYVKNQKYFIRCNLRAEVCISHSVKKYQKTLYREVNYWITGYWFTVRTFLNIKIFKRLNTYINFILHCVAELQKPDDNWNPVAEGALQLRSNCLFEDIPYSTEY